MNCISDACNCLWLQGLRGSEGLRMFHIVRVSDSTRLPQVNISNSDAISVAQCPLLRPLVSDITSHTFTRSSRVKVRMSSPVLIHASLFLLFVHLVGLK